MIEDTLPENLKIPASVGILTLNNAKELTHTLESVKKFADVYICDGNSTDGTQAIAEKFGARIVKQFDTDLPNQRIQSFGDTRTRCFQAAKYDWYVRVDSDEWLSPEVAEEIREIIANPNPPFLVYKMPRKYVYKGKIIDHTITYPNQQIRFFHKQAIAGYTKITHERVVIKPEYADKVGLLKHYQYVPLPDSYEAFWKKFESGLRFDEKQHASMKITRWLGGVLHTAALLTVYTLRFIRVRLSPGNKLPLKFELARFRYQFLVLGITTRNLFKGFFSTSNK